MNFYAFYFFLRICARWAEKRSMRTCDKFSYVAICCVFFLSQILYFLQRIQSGSFCFWTLCFICATFIRFLLIGSSSVLELLPCLRNQLRFLSLCCCSHIYKTRQNRFEKLFVFSHFINCVNNDLIFSNDEVFRLSSKLNDNNNTKRCNPRWNNYN